MQETGASGLKGGAASTLDGERAAEDPRGETPGRTQAYPLDFRERVLDQVENTADRVVDVARRNGISGALLQKWIVKHRPSLAGTARIRGGLRHIAERFHGRSITEDQLTAALIVIGHPVRRAILREAIKGPLRQADVKRAFAMSEPAWSHHFTKMCEVDLFWVSGEGRNKFYVLNRDVLDAIAVRVASLAGGTFGPGADDVAADG